MKIVILFCIVVLCSYVGFGVSANYSERKKFFFDLKHFASALKNEINFSLTKLVEIVTKLNTQIKDKNLNQLLCNYLLYLKTKKEITVDGLFNNICILRQQEKENIYLFFKRLGKVDVFNQINEIENYINIFEEYYLLAKGESEKFCPLYTKMGILIGLFVVIIFA